MAKKTAKPRSKKPTANWPAANDLVEIAKSVRQELDRHLQKIAELQRTPETLLSELEGYREYEGDPVLDGIYHPLCQCRIDREGYFGYVNYVYRQNQERLNEYRQKKDFSGAVGCYEKPFLLDGFVEEMHYADDKSYWTTLRSTWTACEFPSTNRELFLTLFNSPRPCREYLMDDGERKALKKLPDRLEIFRGFAGSRGKGLSWTLDRDKAEWFARRFHVVHGKPPMLLEGTCKKSDAFAYFMSRNESEIVVEPGKVRKQKRTRLKHE